MTIARRESVSKKETMIIDVRKKPISARAEPSAKARTTEKERHLGDHGLFDQRVKILYESRWKVHVRVQKKKK